ncbi:acetyl-CoA carboxylase carboxyl transferase subunit alpha [Aerococcaceae bacterium zg-ZUI334]|uniref:carboxyltransferase subunit alpha n=1 Tax=Aerococcaceae TaxID=186827 RepID=UPI0013B7CA1F|nr:MULTISPECIES: carboxyltransferase subunit alpha [unclassified Facklamia]MBR7927956.1 acetyl-CoA carboxylase carboxyl transferase subunit alpha [Aerococcaceae bacterium zg-ZUI334]NEW64323.1 acetyl-CoA carboxylase carboxyl transferase subunit alpha [Facklamia sp. 252]NEW67840.1 acetyl-CoA carboxylase carboxyl transferase subunit alpha [Facklamia sp. 253]QQD64788.1 acetyl-CoA carboxylase carboxyl transferase subunit alpha [Aerococcaceae bacterium zg-252]
MDAYQIVQKARLTSRISTREIIGALCTEFIECHGDRLMKDDRAIIGGVGLMDGNPITIIGLQKGRNVKSNIRRNFGSAGPSGYRKAQRLMEQAEKFNRPVLTLINTAGAFCAPESEENGIGEAIAQTLRMMSRLSVPTLAIILGEGGSGGAIALALTDEVWMLEHSIYSILSPEGFASILWKDAKLAPQAAEVMKMTAKDLLELNVIDKIINEVDDAGLPIEQEVLLLELVAEIKQYFTDCSALSKEERMKKKYQRFRQF